MSGLTLEQRKKLSDLISQYGISLTFELSGAHADRGMGTDAGRRPLERRVREHEMRKLQTPAARQRAGF